MALFFSPHTTRFAGMNLELGRPSHGKRRLSLLVLTRCSLTVGIPRTFCEGIGFRVDWNFNLEIRLRMVKIC